MKVLVACESSGTVRNAFIANGHEAWSCDILPADDYNLFHFNCDVTKVLNDDWDLILAFPPCTHLSSAGASSWPKKQEDGRQQDAIDFVLEIYNNKCPRISIENPVGKLSTSWRKPDQIIHPYHFGEPFNKKTCLWLKGLKPLIHTNVIEPIYNWNSNSTRGGMRKDGTRSKSKYKTRKAWNSAKDRSKSFKGIAEAMADQWTQDLGFGCRCRLTNKRR